MQVIRELRHIGRFVRLMPLDIDLLSTKSRDLLEELLAFGSPRLYVRGREVISTFYVYPDESKCSLTMYVFVRVEPDKQGNPQALEHEVIDLSIRCKISFSSSLNLKDFLRQEFTQRIQEIDQTKRSRIEKLSRLRLMRATLVSEKKQTSGRNEQISALNSGIKKCTESNYSGRSGGEAPKQN